VLQFVDVWSNNIFFSGRCIRCRKAMYEREYGYNVESEGTVDEKVAVEPREMPCVVLTSFHAVPKRTRVFIMYNAARVYAVLKDQSLFIMCNAGGETLYFYLVIVDHVDS
jgi:hypothetical protein